MDRSAMRIGLLTGGGDCAGLNAAIRAAVRAGSSYGDEILGFHHGWRGVVENEYAVLTPKDTKGILADGGTILHTAGFHPEEHGCVAAVMDNVELNRLDALIVIGGDGTLGSANHLAQLGLPIVGIAKTIDNDVQGTNHCIGFDTAVATCVEAIDRLQTTGESHDRLMVVEVMGRTFGWLAVCSGIAGGADAFCLPEVSTDFDELAQGIRRRHDSGSTSSVVVVAEGALAGAYLGSHDGSAGSTVSRELAQRTGYETRLTVLGHVQRGGPPSASDRLLATRCGVSAVEAVHDGNFATLVSICDESANLVPLKVVASGPRPVPEPLLRVARMMSAR
ncbi:MAG: ATP-dependent 6-phosphofructokinase [Acidimicrobiales bacterium]